LEAVASPTLHIRVEYEITEEKKGTKKTVNYGNVSPGREAIEIPEFTANGYFPARMPSIVSDGDSFAPDTPEKHGLINLAAFK
jgi:hypothetical protein